MKNIKIFPVKIFIITTKRFSVYCMGNFRYAINSDFSCQQTLPFHIKLGTMIWHSLMGQGNLQAGLGKSSPHIAVKDVLYEPPQGQNMADGTVPGGEEIFYNVVH